GNYAWISPLNRTQTAIGDDLASTYSVLGIQYPNLTWVLCQHFNIGHDFSVLSDRIVFKGYVYITKSDVLLLNVPIPSTTGFTSMLQNIGDVETKGIEFNITTENLRETELIWSSSLTFSSNSSVITQLGPEDAPMIMTEPYMDIINKVGEKPFSFYAYKYDGGYMDQEEIDAHDVKYQVDVLLGDGRYVDVNGDGVINSDDRTIIGNP